MNSKIAVHTQHFLEVKQSTDNEMRVSGQALTTTEAIRIFLHQVRIHRGMPFDLRLKEDNADILLPVATRQAALDSLYDE